MVSDLKENGLLWRPRGSQAHEEGAAPILCERLFRSWRTCCSITHRWPTGRTADRCSAIQERRLMQLLAVVGPYDILVLYDICIKTGLLRLVISDLVANKLLWHPRGSRAHKGRAARRSANGNRPHGGRASPVRCKWLRTSKRTRCFKALCSRWASSSTSTMRFPSTVSSSISTMR